MRFCTVILLSLSVIAAATANDTGSCFSKRLQMELAAKEAGLHYLLPEGNGITRELRPGIIRKVESIHESKKVTYTDSNGNEVKDSNLLFVFRDKSGKEITSPKTLERIQKLGIPPAYDDVWISTDPKSHIQAIADDVEGQKQYRYHPDWIAARDRAKFGKLEKFGAALPSMRAQIETDLSLRGMPKEKALASIAKLLDETFIRVGNKEYAQKNETYGLTTLLKTHVQTVKGSTVTLNFVGKADKAHVISVTDGKLAKIVSDLLAFPGDNLFQYRDENGAFHTLDSVDVNDYLRKISGGDFTAKDFRTWGGTVLATRSLMKAGPPATEKAAKDAVDQAVAFAASRLGNTPSVCREKYIDPIVLQSYEDGTFFQSVEQAHAAAEQGEGKLKPEEQTVLFLKAH